MRAAEGKAPRVDHRALRSAHSFAEYLVERRKMMQAWADYLDSLKASAEVIPLFKRA